MGALFAALSAALWLGILTSISPCPLATNIAAVSFIARKVESPRRALFAGLSYIFGRAIAYAAVGSAVVFGLMSAPGVSNFLQRYMNRLLGPILILVGMYLLGLLGLRFSTTVGSDTLREKAAGGGIWGAMLLGFLFALSFCPISAALFFGSLIPLAVAEKSELLLPLLYGLGTGLPVVVVAGLVATGSSNLAKVIYKLDAFQKWAQIATGAIFVVIGIYFTVRFIFLA